MCPVPCFDNDQQNIRDYRSQNCKCTYYISFDLQSKNINQHCSQKCSVVVASGSHVPYFNIFTSFQYKRGNAANTRTIPSTEAHKLPCICWIIPGFSLYDILVWLSAVCIPGAFGFWWWNTNIIIIPLLYLVIYNFTSQCLSSYGHSFPFHRLTVMVNNLINAFHSSHSSTYSKMKV